MGSKTGKDFNKVEKLSIPIDTSVPYKGIVKERNSSGFYLDMVINDQLKEGFLPNTISGINKLTELQLQDLVGKEIDVMLEVYNDKPQNHGGTFVVNRRKFIKNFIVPESLKKVEEQFNIDNEKFKKGEIEQFTKYSGMIINVVEYGIFIEFDVCLTGLLHKDNMDDVTKQKFETLKVGDTIDFYIREFLTDKKTQEKKIILTQIIKTFLWDRYRSSDKKYKKGMYKPQVGVVDKILKGGLLIRLDEITTGLLQTCYIDDITKYKIGDEVNVRIIGVFKNTRKIYFDFYKKEN